MRYLMKVHGEDGGGYEEEENMKVTKGGFGLISLGSQPMLLLERMFPNVISNDNLLTNWKEANMHGVVHLLFWKSDASAKTNDHLNS